MKFIYAPRKSSREVFYEAVSKVSVSLVKGAFRLAKIFSHPFKYLGTEHGSRLGATFLGCATLFGGYLKWNSDYQYSKERDYKVALFQQKLRLYEELTDTTARLSKANTLEIWNTNRDNFWALHFGPIRMTGNRDLIFKLKHFGKEVVKMNALINQTKGPEKYLPPVPENFEIYNNLSFIAREISDLCKQDLDIARSEIDALMKSSRRNLPKTTPPLPQQQSTVLMPNNKILTQ
jgi:hypothetical protein